MGTEPYMRGDPMAMRLKMHVGVVSTDLNNCLSAPPDRRSPAFEEDVTLPDDTSRNVRWGDGSPATGAWATGAWPPLQSHLRAFPLPYAPALPVQWSSESWTGPSS